MALIANNDFIRGLKVTSRVETLYFHSESVSMVRNWQFSVKGESTMKISIQQIALIAAVILVLWLHQLLVRFDGYSFGRWGRLNLDEQ